MKKLLIIFIIACCLLCFIEIPYLAKETLNYGDLWNSFSDYEKLIFFIGFNQGTTEGICDCLEQFAPYFLEKKESKEKVRAFVLIFNKYEQYAYFISSNNDAIMKIITNLYKDPANTYIPIYDICFLACQKLKGEDIESPLREAREKALKNKENYNEN